MRQSLPTNKDVSIDHPIINILLIGGEGYIGNVVAQSLLEEGYIVTSYDNLLYNNHHCVTSKINSKNYHFIYGDMMDYKKLKSTIENADAVILLAGLVGDPITKTYPKVAGLINDDGVKNVIDLCAKQNIEKFIFISTCCFLCSSHDFRKKYSSYKR